MSNGNPKLEGNLGFQSLLYYSFILKKKYRVDETAEKMGIRPDTLYRYVRGENTMPPDRIVDLFKATGDIEFLEFFCAPCGYIPVKTAQGKLYDTPLKQDEVDLSILAGKMLDEIEHAHRDGVIDKREFSEIQKLTTRLQEKAAEIREKIKAEVK